MKNINLEYCSITSISPKIYVVKFHEIAPDESHFDAYLLTLESFYRNLNKPIVVIFDAQDCKFLPSELRIKHADWLDMNRDLVVSKVIKSIYIVSNPVMEFLFESIFLMQHSPVPYEIVHSMEMARRKGHLMLADTK